MGKTKTEIAKEELTFLVERLKADIGPDNVQGFDERVRNIETAICLDTVDTMIGCTNRMRRLCEEKNYSNACKDIDDTLERIENRSVLGM